MQEINQELLSEIMEKFNKLKEDSDVSPDDTTQKELEELLGFSFNELNTEMDMMFKTNTIKVKKLHPDAVMPKYAYGSDSGFDLHAVDTHVLSPFGRALVATGISVQFNENLEIQVRPKSGLALNMGLTVLNTPGTVDQGYTGEIKVIIFNTSDKGVVIEKGMKIAQAVLCPVINGKYVNFELLENELESTDRGNNGFGSTGI